MRFPLLSTIAFGLVARVATAQDAAAPLAPPEARPLPAVESAANAAAPTYAPPVATEPALPAPLSPPVSATDSPPVAPPSGPSAPLAPRALRPAPLAPPRAQPLPGARVVVRRGYEVPPPRFVPPRRHGDAGAPLALSLGPTFKWRTDHGYDRFTLRGEHTASLELAASYDVLQPLSRVVIAAGLSYRLLAEANDTLALTEHELSADLVARVRALSWLAPHVRVGAGLVQTRVTLEDHPAQRSFADTDLGWLATAGAGVTLHTPSRSFETRRGRLASLSLGLLVEGGYAFAPDAPLRVARGESAGVPRAAVDLGTLTRAAPYLRLAAVARF